MPVPDIQYDERFGWFRWVNDRAKPVAGEPFRDRDEAILYALGQTRQRGAAPWAVVVNVRKALEWACAQQQEGR